jgi:hypothetical protein
MSARKAVTDAASKDIMRQMKSGLVDKALPVERATADVWYSWTDSLADADAYFR